MADLATTTAPVTEPAVAPNRTVVVERNVGDLSVSPVVRSSVIS